MDTTTVLKDRKRMIICQSVSFITHVFILSLILLPIFIVKYALSNMQNSIHVQSIDLNQGFTLPVQMILEQKVDKKYEDKIVDKVVDEKEQFDSKLYEKSEVEEKYSVDEQRDDVESKLLDTQFNEVNSLKPILNTEFTSNSKDSIDSYDIKNLLRAKKKSKKISSVKKSNTFVSQDEVDLPQPTPIFGTSHRWEDKFLINSLHDTDNADLMKAQFNEFHVVLNCPVPGKAMVIDSYEHMKNHIIDMDQKTVDEFTQLYSSYCLSVFHSAGDSLVGHSIWLMVDRNKASSEFHSYRVNILYKKTKPLCEEVIAKANSNLKKHGLSITDPSVIQIFVKFNGDHDTPGKHTYTYTIPYALIRKDSGVEKLMFDP